MSFYTKDNIFTLKTLNFLDKVFYLVEEEEQKKISFIFFFK